MLSRAERQAATVVLMLIVGVLLVFVYILTNDTSRASSDARIREEQIARGQQLFAANCAVCHGNHGQGGVGLPLNVAANRPTSEAQATQRTEYLTRTISNGRPGTFMPAWALSNNGPLNEEQVGALVDMIEYGDWAQTQAVVDAYQAKNGTPPPPTNPSINTGGVGGNPALATVGPIPSNVQNPNAAAPAVGGSPAAGSSAPATIIGDGLTINATEKDFSIALDTSLVKAGTVTFHIKNDGPSPHDISIKELNKTSDVIDPGKSADFKVDLKDGTYTVICSIPGHEQLGMKVMLKVGNAASAGSVAQGSTSTVAASQGPLLTAARSDDGE
jgi:mono/diheme cytochrome c family protein/plastocyanin